MTRTEEFAAFRDRRREQEAKAAVGRVTWRKVAIETGGGWSGIGSAGPRLVVRLAEIGLSTYSVWIRRGRADSTSTTLRGVTLREAKRRAADLLNEAIAADAATSSDPEEGT